MRRASKVAHLALKQQAKRDLEELNSRFPSDEEVAKAPPPTPEAVARMEEIFARFKQENEERKALQAQVETDTSFEELFRRPKRRWRTRKKVVVSVAACMAFVLGTYTCACAYTSATTGASFVNVFCNGYVMVKRADDPNVEDQYQIALQSFINKNQDRDFYYPKWMISGFTFIELKVNETNVEIKFSPSSTKCVSSQPLSFTRNFYPRNIDMDVDDYKIIPQDNIEYIYTIKTIDGDYRQMLFWNVDDNQFYLKHCTDDSKELLPEDDLLKIAQSMDYHQRVK